jgi:hypothetical protein
MPRSYKVLALVGDGIAEEIVPEALKVLEATQEAYGFDLEILGPYEFGARYYVDHDMEAGWDPAMASRSGWEGCLDPTCPSTRGSTSTSTRTSGHVD